jgi:hypothetical protein
MKIKSNIDEKVGKDEGILVVGASERRHIEVPRTFQLDRHTLRMHGANDPKE